MSDQRGLTGLGTDHDDGPSGGRPLGLVVGLGAAAVAVAIIVIIVVLRTTDDGGTPQPAGGAVSTSPSSTTGAGPGSPAASPSRSSESTSPAGSTESSATSSADAPSDQPEPGQTRSPVPIKTPAEVKASLTASITDAEAVKGQADGPGEVAGPAVRFTLTLRNSTADEVPLNTTVVNVYYGKAKTPASPLSAPGGVPLPDRVAAGDEASGTYLFVVPRKARDRVLITVDYSVDVSLVAFRGSVPR